MILSKKDVSCILLRNIYGTHTIFPRVSEYALAEKGRTGMKKHIACPVCGFRRLVDADEKTKSEVCEESEIKPDWRPDYYAKCKKCGKQITHKGTGYSGRQACRSNILSGGLWHYL